MFEHKNPFFEIAGTKQAVFIEKDEPGRFEPANDYLRDSRLSHTEGYYCDPFQEITAVPAVYSLGEECAECGGLGRDACAACDGEGITRVYYAAIFDPYDRASGGIVDAEESYTNAEEAARAAHGFAERYAESERGYQIKEMAVLRIEELCEEFRGLRTKHSAIVCGVDARYAAANIALAEQRADYRERAHATAERIRELRATWGITE